jgi:hypothetical protein
MRVCVYALATRQCAVWRMMWDLLVDYYQHRSLVRYQVPKYFPACSHHT